MNDRTGSILEEEDSGLAQRSLDEGRRFARRMYLPRVFGLALGVLCVGGALWEQGARPVTWAILFAGGLVWPHVAWLIAHRSDNPHRAELRNLMVDSAQGGMWMALLGFNLVPSAVLASMLAMDKIAVGGVPFLARCLAAQAVAVVATVAAIHLSTGFSPSLESSVPVVVASLPLLIGYPIAVGVTAHRLARRVRQQNMTLAALSSLDGLTGLLNRMHWEQAVATEFQRCRRIGHRSALMMIDIDNFKEVNDTHGHLAGDEVIRNVARLMRTTLRMHDVPARYGGEEFGVVLPGTDVAGGSMVAERLRSRIESAVLDPHSGVHATISIGITAFSPEDTDHAAWIARADRALYRAKAQGRNRVVGDDAAAVAYKG